MAAVVMAAISIPPQVHPHRVHPHHVQHPVPDPISSSSSVSISKQPISTSRRVAEKKAVRSDSMPSIESLSPKRFFDFLTDPSLLITVLHSLEVAYWTFPFGFILTPVINFFRVPNRRRSLEMTRVERILEKLYSQEASNSKAGRMWRRMDSLPPQEQQQLHDLYVKVLQSLAQQNKLNRNHARHLHLPVSTTRLRK